MQDFKLVKKDDVFDLLRQGVSVYAFYIQTTKQGYDRLMTSKLIIQPLEIINMIIANKNVIFVCKKDDKVD